VWFWWVWVIDTPSTQIYATMAHDNEVDEVNFRYRDTGFVSIEVSRYFEDDITVRAGGA